MSPISNVQVTRRLLAGLQGHIEAAQYRAAALLSKAQDKDEKAARYLRRILDDLEDAGRHGINLYRYIGGAALGLDVPDEDEAEEVMT